MKLNLKLIIILLLATSLRFYQLGSNPPSLDWDEVSLAYNAKSLLETGRDEYGNTWPLTIRSFNDYKPPLYSYALIPSLMVLGKSEFAVRLPSAVAGSLTVLATYFLVKELFSRQQTRNKSKQLSLAIGNWKFEIEEIVAGLLAISPWHSHLSRVAFEANLGLFFFVSGMLAFLKARRSHWWLPVSALSFGLSLLAYHSTKVVVPLLLVLISWPYLKTFFQHKQSLIIAGVIALTFLALIGRTIQQGVGQARLNTVSFTTIDNLLDKSRARIEKDEFSLFSRIINHRFLIYGKEVLGGYLDHYNLNFWLTQGDTIARLTYVTTLGLIYWWSFPFLLLGLFKLVSVKSDARRILFSWFLVAPAASALTSGTPNAIRSIFFLPTFQIFTALGIVSFAAWISQKKNWFSSLCSLVFGLLALVNVLIYFHHYYRHAPQETSRQWQYGYKQLVGWLMSVKDNYDQVVVTTEYDQPYIYALWYGDYSPSALTNDGEFYKGFDNFVFRPIDILEDKKLSQVLLVGSPKEIGDSQKAIWQIDFLDGSPAFIALESDN